jgi:tRNA(Ile)-lysidine synthase
MHRRCENSEMKSADGLREEFLRTVEKYRMVSRGDKVLCALSGGADSVALTVLFSTLADELGIELYAAHLNHCLRGISSDNDERFVREFCRSRGIPLETARMDVAGISKAEGAGIEETARKVRYRFLHESAERFGCTKIATAHNANDNAETIIMNIARGTGIRGLCGIPPVRGMIIRPLLFSERKTIEEYLDSQRTGHVTDESNFDDSYTRNRIRHRVIPALLEINPSLIKNMGEMAELLRSDADYLDSLAAGKFPTGSVSTSVPEKELNELHDAVSGRVIRGMYTAAREGKTGSLSKEHVDSVKRLAGQAGPSGEVHLPGGITAKRIYGILKMTSRTGNEELPEEKELVIGENIFGGWRIVAEIVDENDGTFKGKGIGNTGKTDRSGHAVYLDPSLVDGGIRVRARKNGDTISPVDRSWTKSLKKLYIEMKIPRDERTTRPVIVCGDAVCAIPGFSADRRFAASGPPAVRITFIKYTDI